ncbi:MAG: methyl-accepting chemotaxis protein [Ignavibacteria bacterium]|jgi:methyl-accepting chemotaxis protein
MKLMNFFKKSIRAQIVSGVVATLALIVAFSSIYYPAKQKSISMETVEAQVVTLSEMLSFSVGIGLSEGNFEIVQTAFSWAQKDKHVVYILIQDENDDEIVTYNPSDLSVKSVSIKDEDEIKRTNDDVLVSTTIDYKNNKLGKIVLVYSLDEVNKTIADNTFFSVLISLVIFVVGVIFIFMLTKVIIGQINKLNNAAREVAAGNLNVDLNIDSENEVGVLASSFKTMTQSIKNANDQLKEEKDSIAGKVEEAVRESEQQKEYLSNSIDRILAEMNKFADGDLTVKIDSGKDDEIGKLYSGFNKAVQNINEMIIQVAGAVTATANASNEISSSSEEMAAGAQEQSAQTNEVATAIEEMTKTIMETTRNASLASDTAKNAGTIAQEGGNVVLETIEGMNRIADVVSKSASTVQELGKSSDQIGEIVQVIDDIADQTNLLALNAAIEAARAGEQGRGFAVVADEVRKLAERTTKATKEIAAMIKQIQKDTATAVKSMVEGKEEVENGKQLTDKAGKSLKEIIGGAEKVVDVIAQVAASSEEQSATSEEVSKNIEAISNVTNESAAGIQEIARASEDLNKLTVDLQELIAKFKIESVASEESAYGLHRLNDRSNGHSVNNDNMLLSG